MKPLLILGAVLLGGFLAFRVLFGGWTESWNQRLTVIVDTPAGPVSGSAVTRVTDTDNRGLLVLLDASGVRSAVTGEAVAVEVLPGRWLFALLSGSDDWSRDATNWVYPTYVDPTHAGEPPPGPSYEEAMEIVDDQPYDTPVPVPPEGWPMMVTFDDITRPETVRLVDPANLAATFGPGVSLQAVTLEMTRAGVTEGAIEQVLLWACTHYRAGQTLNGQTGSIGDNLLPSRLSAGNFMLGGCE